MSHTRLICGIVHFHPSSLSASLLDKMCAAMIGPDLKPVRQVWHGESSALAVLDFGTTMPQVQRRRCGAVLAADARLDGDLKPSPFAKDTTEERCAEWLDQHGIEGLGRILGDFALADWNPDRRELLLARDAVGVRPLVFHHVPGVLVAFASFPRALHAAGLPAREVEPGSLIREMVGVSGRGETLFRGVQAVEPGSALLFSARGQSLQRFAELRPADPFKTPEEGAEALRAAITSAVQDRVCGSGTVAAHLSGGLDSSAIAILAARSLRAQHRQLLTYSLLAPTLAAAYRNSEQGYVEAVLKQEPDMAWFPFPSGDPLRWRGNLDRVLSTAPDDPDNAICAHAGGHGASLILSGWGGDEGATFNGRGALADALCHGRLGYLRQEVSRLRTVRGFSRGAILRGEILHFFREALPAWTHRGGQSPLECKSLLNPVLLREALRTASRPSTLGVSVRRNQRLLINGRHLEMRISNWAEISARFGVAFSFPMLDRRVVACALAMHPTWHLRGGWRRRPFRDAMKGILPEIIRWRHDKLQPFPESHARLASQRDLLRAEIAGLCSRPEIAEVFSVPRVSALMNDFPSLPELAVDLSRGTPILPALLMMTYGRFLAQESV